MTWSNRKREPGVLKNANGMLTLDTNQILKKWTEYIELFDDNETGQMETETENNNILKLLKAEIPAATKNNTKWAVVGLDKIPVATLKCMNDDSLYTKYTKHDIYHNNGQTYLY